MKQTTLWIGIVLVVMGSSVWGRTVRDTGPVSDTQVLDKRPDVAATIYAAAAEMRGIDSNLPEVSFTPAARQALRADGFDYVGFGPPRFTLMRFAESESDPDQIEIGAVMVFSDALLRRVSMSVLLTCTWNESGDHITVHSATAQRVTPAPPKVLLVIVPASRVPADLLTTHSHAQLLPWLLANKATDEELAAGDADECYLFAFNYDRFNPGATLNIVIGRKPGDLDGKAGNGQDIDYDGWHVAVMNGTFEWQGKDTFYIKVLQTSSPPDSARAAVLLLSSDLVVVDSLGRAVGPGPLMQLGDRTMHIIAGVLAGVGLLACLLGYRLGRVYLAVVGLLVGAVAASVVLELVVLDRSMAILVLIALPVAGAVVFGVNRWLGWMLQGAAVGGAVAVLAGAPVSCTSVGLLAGLGAGVVIGAVFHRVATILISGALGAGLLAAGAGQYIGLLDIRTWRVDRLCSVFVDQGFDLPAGINAMDTSDWLLVVLAGIAGLAGVLIQLATTGRTKAEPESPAAASAGED